MKTIAAYLILTFIFLTACDKSDINTYGIGIAEYYPSFLFVKADTMSISKKFDFEFSDDAIGDKSYINFYLADADNKPIDLEKDKIEVFFNGKKITDKFVIKATPNNNPQEIEIKITPLPGAKRGNHNFYLTTSKGQHNLQRIDNIDLNQDGKIKFIKLGFGYKMKMNPLAKALLIILCIIIASLMIWFIMIKPILYPTFKGIKKQISIYDTSTRNVIFKGYREVILSNSKMKDSFWSSLFKGKRLFVIDSNISDPIVFYPYKKGNAALIKIKNTNYLIDINPMTKIGVTKIKNINTKKEIIIK